MKRNIFLSVAALATVMTMTVTSCSSSDDDEKQGGQPQVAYVWGTEGSIKTCDHLLFGTVVTENVNGTVIGNGDKEFILKGKQTLKKGTYLLRGWVYVGDGAELTIEPGTIIKGEKESAASLIVEPGGIPHCRQTVVRQDFSPPMKRRNHFPHRNN